MIDAPKELLDILGIDIDLLYYNSHLCERYESSKNGGKDVDYSKQVQDRHNQIMHIIEDERRPVLKNHYRNLIIMVNEGSEQVWPSCNPFHNKCNGGDYEKLDEIQRAHLEWTCFHGVEQRDIEFENLSFQEWYKVRYRNAIINEDLIKRFQRDFNNYHLALGLELS